MKSARVAMWSGGRKLRLDDILSRLSFSCDIEWMLYEFSGSGVAPNGQAMPDFEKALFAESIGYRFSTDGLVKFSKSLVDVVDLKLAGVCGDSKALEVIGVDSGYWEVFVDEKYATWLPGCSSV